MANREELIQQIRRQFKDADTGFNERQRRQWAAAESLRLGRGGIAVVSTALRISPNTVRKGIAEITETVGNADSAETPRIRRVGGGRKSQRSSRNSQEQA